MRKNSCTLMFGRYLLRLSTVLIGAFLGVWSGFCWRARRGWFPWRRIRGIPVPEPGGLCCIRRRLWGVSWGELSRRRWLPVRQPATPTIQAPANPRRTSRRRESGGRRER